MPYSIHARRLTPPRARLLTAAALLSGVLVAGCGGSSTSPTGGASTSASAARAVESGVAFARCIRSHGVPSFADPKVSGQTVRMGSPRTIESPAFQSALRSCQRLLPKGAPGPEASSPQAQARMLEFVRLYAQARDLGVPRSEHLASIELGRQQRDHWQRRVLPCDPELDRHGLAGVQASGGRVQLRAGAVSRRSRWRRRLPAPQWQQAQSSLSASLSPAAWTSVSSDFGRSERSRGVRLRPVSAR